MQIIFDFAKRDRTLSERGLDFADAALIFTGRHFTKEDDRQDYGESRFISVGLLTGRMIIFSLDPARRGSPHHFHEESQ